MNTPSAEGLPEFVAVGEFVGYGRVTGEPHVRMSSGLRPGVRLFTEDQMRAYGELCRAAPAGSGEVEAFCQRLDEVAAEGHDSGFSTIADLFTQAAALLRKLQQGAE